VPALQDGEWCNCTRPFASVEKDKNIYNFFLVTSSDALCIEKESAPNGSRQENAVLPEVLI
jgi:hypothetical protein